MFFQKYYKKTDGAIRAYDLHSTRTKILCVVVFAVCLFFIVIALFPPVWVFLASFKDFKEFNTHPSLLPRKFDIKVYIKTWNELKFVKHYISSLIVVAGSIVCAVIFNGLLGYVLAVVKPKGHKLILGLVLWSLLIPSTSSMVALFVNIKRIGLAGSYLPLWLSVGASAFYVLLFKQFFEGIPKELIEAAALDGCGYLRIFALILVPLSKSIVTVIIIFSINAAWSDFLLPFLVLNGSGRETVMVRLFAFRLSNTTPVDILRAVAFSIIPPIILFGIFQKQITEGAAAGAIKG